MHRVERLRTACPRWRRGVNGPSAGHAREEVVGTPIDDVPAWLVLVVVEGGVAPCVVWHDRFLVLFTGLRG
jgi:hypothetical protein